MVGLAFAVAASTFAPLLILGVWWRALSTIGAIAGLLTGAVAATAAIFASIALRPVDGWPGWTGALLSQPAAWSVPLATLVTVVVSLSTPASVPPGTTRLLVRLHTPEGVDVSRSRPDD
jgi:cation/acetate symporter